MGPQDEEDSLIVALNGQTRQTDNQESLPQEEETLSDQYYFDEEGSDVGNDLDQLIAEIIDDDEEAESPVIDSLVDVNSEALSNPAVNEPVAQLISVITGESVETVQQEIEAELTGESEPDLLAGLVETEGETVIYDDAGNEMVETFLNTDSAEEQTAFIVNAIEQNPGPVQDALEEALKQVPEEPEINFVPARTRRSS